MFQKILAVCGERKYNKQWYCIIVFIVLFAQFSFGQTGVGKLTGKVTDGSTNEAIIGVSVSAKDTKYGKSSIADGTYNLSLPAGIYTILYSHTGYITKEITSVIIKEGQPTFLEMILQPGNNKMVGVVVTSTLKREAQSSLYSAQKRSAAASDGISLEAIKKTPDNNAGQILKRVVGLNVQDNRFVVVRGLNDQYNQTMLNGVPMTSTETNRNAFAFDLIPAAVIDNITVNKTATPDMPGNFAGGIVQVNTKDFPAKDFFSITLQTGLSDQTYGKNFYADKRSKVAVLGFAEKSLELPKNFPTALSEAPIYYLQGQERTRYLRMLTNNLAPINYGPSGLNENVQFGFGKTIKLKNETQFGIVAAISQRKTTLIEQEIVARNPVFSNDLSQPPPDTLQSLAYYSENKRYRYSVDLGGVVNLAYRFGNSKITLKNLYSQVLNNIYTDRPVVRISNDNYFNSIDREYIGVTYFIEKKSIFNSTLAGEHRTGKNNETKLEWNVNATLNNTNTPDTRNFIFGMKNTMSKVLNGDANLDYAGALTGASRAWSYNKDLIYGGAFNISTPYNLGGNKHLLKTGIIFQNRQRVATGTVLPMDKIPQTVLDSILSPTRYSPSGLDINAPLLFGSSNSSNYNAGSSLLAAYESMENKIGKKLRIIWGVRVEDYQQTIAINSPVYLRDFQEPLQQTADFNSRTTINILPSVNLIYGLTSNINIRAAYSKTVIRPELKDLASFARYDYQSFSLIKGNKFLKSASITNYDFKFEYFPTAGEIISLSGFYKKLIDPIEYSRGSTLLDYEKFRIPVNAGDATVKGIEFEIRKKIDFVPFAKWLSHVSFSGNGTLLHSKVKRKEINNEYFTYLGEHTLTGQANYIINAGISVDLFKNTFESTISFNRTGDYNNELGSSDFIRRMANGNLVAVVPPYRVKARNMVDFVMSQSLIKDKFKIKFNISNLLNKPYILYQDINGNGKFDTPIIIDKLNGAILGGIDNTASSIVPQRTYSLAFTYTF